MIELCHNRENDMSNITFSKFSKKFLMTLFFMIIGAFLFLNYITFPELSNKADIATENKKIEELKETLASMRVVTWLLPQKKPFYSLYQSQLEFLNLQISNRIDKKGSLFYLQGLKAKIQTTIESGFLGMKSEELFRKGNTLLAIISRYEMDNLRSSIVELQKESIKYQAEEQMKAYETFGKSMSSKEPQKNK